MGGNFETQNYKVRRIRWVLVFIIIVLMSVILTGCTVEEGLSTDQSQQTLDSKPESQADASSTPSSNQDGNPSEQSAEQVPNTLAPESMISVAQLDVGIKTKQDWVIIDVREPFEFASGHVPNAINIPLGTLEQNLSQFPKDKEIILVCHTGSRAFTAWQNLMSKGYDPSFVKVMIGGMEQWKGLGSGEITESIGGC